MVVVAPFHFNIIGTQCHLFAVQLTTYLWDILSFNNLQYQQQANPILSPWAAESQAVMWSMEFLHQAIFIQCEWILGMSETLDVLT